MGFLMEWLFDFGQDGAKEGFPPFLIEGISYYHEELEFKKCEIDLRAEDFLSYE
jgi:hypothetical protein